MGANAQTSVPTFTAGEVLTAANMNISARTGVPVFATTVTRDAAFGGTGEKTLAEGQFCYVEGTGLQTYDGANWITWGTAPAAGALVLISSTTIGTSVTSVAITNCFNATYENYKIIISGGSASATSDGSFQLGSANTGYSNAFVYNGYTSATPTGVATNNTSTSSTVFAYSANGYNLDLTLFQPQMAKRTSWVYLSSTIASASNRWAGGGFQDSATQFTGITFSTQGGHTLTGGTIKVYGFQN